MAYSDTLRFSLLIFGDGMIATLIDERPRYFHKQLKIWMTKLLIVPHPALIEIWNIPREQLVVDTIEGPGMWCEYPTVMIRHLNNSRTYGVVDILCNFVGDDTERTKEKEDLIQRNNLLLQEVESLKITNYSLQERNTKLLTKAEDYLADMAKLQKIAISGREQQQEQGENYNGQGQK